MNIHVQVPRWGIGGVRELSPHVIQVDSAQHKELTACVCEDWFSAAVVQPSLSGTGINYTMHSCMLMSMPVHMHVLHVIPKT